MNYEQASVNRAWMLCGWVLAAALLSGCSGIVLISDYDQETDKGLMALQQKADDFVESLKGVTGTDAGAFAKHQVFYEETDRDLRRLEFRVSSIPKNKHTEKLVADIRSALLGKGLCTTEGTSLRDLHCLPASKDKGPSKASLDVAQRSVNQTISAALSLELAKKQGLEKNE